MKRKVVQHGPSTLIISLPTTWIKQNEVKKGDELEITEDNKILTISTNNYISTKSLSQNISTLEPYLVTAFLTRIYQKGFDKAYLVHDNPMLLKKIQEKTLELIGYEIIEQNKKYCLIQSISSHIELDFDNSLRKAFMITKQMLEIAIKAYKEKDTQTLEGLQIMDLEVNRLCNFCLRQINKEQYVGTEQMQQSHILYGLIESLEHLGDDMVSLGKHLVSARKNNNNMLMLLNTLFEQYELVHSNYYKSSIRKVNDAFRVFIRLDKMLSESGRSVQEAELLAIFNIRAASSELHHFTISDLDFPENSMMNTSARVNK